ncbi:hypothetical protein BCAH1134_C0151 (plasmid) [Bacillus cereus AH1134]|nr:hypothetical protein BCAH1134_C0151 [Bacillus cereus AH1134]
MSQHVFCEIVGNGDSITSTEGDLFSKIIDFNKSPNLFIN